MASPVALKSVVLVNRLYLVKLGAVNPLRETELVFLVAFLRF
jgi:hypothetical protein